MKKTTIFNTLAAATIALSVSSMATAREYISIVGSSTVYPFTTVVAERFGRATGMNTPKVESTGTGGGLKLFCGGIGVDYPDATNASRAIKQSEIDLCKANGVNEIVELKVGYDGIVLANSRKGHQFNLSMREIFMALGKQVPGPDGELIDNPYTTWDQINSELPNVKIEVLGPPPTSGTRDAFVELAMEGGAKTFDSLTALDSDVFKAVAHTMREDGAFIEAGENDNLIVQKLQANPAALGIFGFSFLDQNADQVQGSVIDGVAPEFEAIAEGEYKVSRPLFLYVKAAHVGIIPGMETFLSEYTSDNAWGDEGYLSDKGLIPMPEQERDTYSENIKNLNPL